MYTHSPPFSLLASPSVLALAARLSLAATSLAPWHPHSARFGSRELCSFCKTQYAAHFRKNGLYSHIAWAFRKSGLYSHIAWAFRSITDNTGISRREVIIGVKNRSLGNSIWWRKRAAPCLMANTQQPIMHRDNHVLTHPQLWRA